MACHIHSLYIFGACICTVRSSRLSNCAAMVAVKCSRAQVIANWCFFVVTLLTFSRQHLDPQFEALQVDPVFLGVFVVGGMFLGMHGFLGR
ncbi:Uncharacterised protein [Pseudomonas aeruginosa]|nr:Uncharacterised protein [Pseudomonas aeruginosa]